LAGGGAGVTILFSGNNISDRDVFYNGTALVLSHCGSLREEKSVSVTLCDDFLCGKADVTHL